MAGDNDRDRIGAVGLSDRARRPRQADAVGDLTVAKRPTVRYLHQRVPDTSLKRRAGGSELEVERRASTGKILGELVPDAPTAGRVAVLCGSAWPESKLDEPAGLIDYKANRAESGGQFSMISFCHRSRAAPKDRE